MIKYGIFALLWAICISVTGTASAQSAPSEAVARFYKGKTVYVISPSGTGGSIYLYAQLVSNHIGRHIPGNPNVVVQARPGGGGLTAANYVSNAAPKDGTVIAELHPSSLLHPVTGKGANYNPREFNWLGSVAVRSYVGAVWHTVPVQSLEDMRDKEYIFGGSGVASASYQYPVFLSYLTGAKIKVIAGYKSGGETNLALERGEVQGRGNYYEGFLATNPDWIRDKKIKFIFKIGADHPDLASVPAATRYATTEKQKALLRVLEAPLSVGLAFYVAKEVPKDRTIALRDAFKKMLVDPQFLAEADKSKLFVNPLNHEKIAKVVSEVFATPPRLFEELEAIIAPK
nr:hypothetical protein [Rhodoferax sp.]